MLIFGVFVLVLIALVLSGGFGEEYMNHRRSMYDVKIKAQLANSMVEALKAPDITPESRNYLISRLDDLIDGDN